jgi:hypothetical protein
VTPLARSPSLHDHPGRTITPSGPVVLLLGHAPTSSHPLQQAESSVLACDDAETLDLVPAQKNISPRGPIPVPVHSQSNLRMGSVDEAAQRTGMSERGERRLCWEHSRLPHGPKHQSDSSGWKETLFVSISFGRGGYRVFLFRLKLSKRERHKLNEKG